MRVPVLIVLLVLTFCASVAWSQIPNGGCYIPAAGELLFCSMVNYSTSMAFGQNEDLRAWESHQRFLQYASLAGVLITDKCITLHRYLTCAITFRACYDNNPGVTFTLPNVSLLPPCSTLCGQFIDECKFTNYGEDCSGDLYDQSGNCTAVFPTETSLPSSALVYLPLVSLVIMCLGVAAAAAAAAAA